MNICRTAPSVQDAITQMPRRHETSHNALYVFCPRLLSPEDLTPQAINCSRDTTECLAIGL